MSCVFKAFYDAWNAEKAESLASERIEQSNVSEDEKNMAHVRWLNAQRRFVEAHTAALAGSCADRGRP